MTLRIIFMGTPEYSVPTLTALVEAGHDVAAVYTQPPRPGGRGMGEKKSPVHIEAEKHQISVLYPASLKDEAEQREFARFNADIAVVVAYGLLLPVPVLEAPELGCINGHASLLPRWRGAAPIQRAIEAGDDVTGVMIMQMEKGLDTGPVMLSQSVPIPDQMTAGELHDQLSELTAELTIDALNMLEAGEAKFAPQDEEGVTYAHKLKKSESRINWDRPAREVHNHIRAMSPFPGAWYEMDLGGKNTRVKILASEHTDGTGEPGTILDDQLTIACKDGAIRPVRLQKAGKQAADLGQFLLGNKVSAGAKLN